VSKFLSAEWADDVTAALNSHEGFKNAIGAADLSIQFQTEDGPDGPVDYFLSTSGGTASLALGEVESPDVTVKQSYDTATAISKGEMNTQTAFMTGKLKVSGNLAKLMMHQSAIAQWGAAVSGLDVEYSA
jgi:putative sterol carrier protein